MAKNTIQQGMHKIINSTVYYFAVKICFILQLYIEDMARKIDDLLQSIDDLFNLLPVNDPVLEALNCKVKEYCNLIPLLKQLSSKSVKVCTSSAHVHVHSAIFLHVHTCTYIIFQCFLSNCH